MVKNVSTLSSNVLNAMQTIPLLWTVKTDNYYPHHLYQAVTPTIAYDKGRYRFICISLFFSLTDAWVQ